MGLAGSGPDTSRGGKGRRCEPPFDILAKLFLVAFGRQDLLTAPPAGAELKVAWLDRFESGGSSRGGRSGVGFLLKLPNIYSSSSGSEGAAGRRAGWWAVVGGRWSVGGGRWAVGGGRGAVWSAFGGGGRFLAIGWRGESSSHFWL